MPCKWLINPFTFFIVEYVSVEKLLTAIMPYDEISNAGY